MPVAWSCKIPLTPSTLFRKVYIRWSSTYAFAGKQWRGKGESRRHWLSRRSMRNLTTNHLQRYRVVAVVFLFLWTNVRRATQNRMALFR